MGKMLNLCLHSKKKSMEENHKKLLKKRESISEVSNSSAEEYVKIEHCDTRLRKKEHIDYYDNKKNN